MSPVTAQSKIVLRSFDLSDLPVVFRWISRTPSLFHDDAPKTERAFVDSHLARGSRNVGVYRGSELVGLFICDHETPQVCQAHIYFKRTFLGWKNTLPALQQGVDFAWSLGYEKITAPVFEGNRLMIRLLAELGAVQEALFRRHRMQNGQPINVAFYSIFKGD